MRFHLDTHIPFDHQKERCHWCGNSLARIRNIFKGVDSQRHYDSESCLKRGEERALRYRAALAGTVSSHWLIGLAMFLAFFMGAYSAKAHDPNTHQATELSNARSKIGGQCCDGTDYAHVSPSAWERTDTGFRIKFGQAWIEVPQDAVVHNMKNPDGEAKVWIGLDENGVPFVRCFMSGMEG